MLCQHCHINPATTIYKQVINGKAEVIHLCDDCSQQMGIHSEWASGFPSFHLNDIFSEFFNNTGMRNEIQNNICKKCGTTLKEITSTGNLGCDECIRTFEKELTPLIRKIHGNAAHSGKIPNSAGAELKRKAKISEMKSQLDRAVETQNFEEAAKLRDQIQQLEKQGQVNKHE